MKVKTVTKSVNMKVNTGDYGNFDIYSAATIEVEEGDKLTEVLEKLQNLVMTDLLEQKAVMDDLEPATYGYKRKR